MSDFAECGIKCSGWKGRITCGCRRCEPPKHYQSRGKARHTFSNKRLMRRGRRRLSSAIIGAVS